MVQAKQVGRDLVLGGLAALSGVGVNPFGDGVIVIADRSKTPARPVVQSLTQLAIPPFQSAIDPLPQAKSKSSEDPREKAIQSYE